MPPTLRAARAADGINFSRCAVRADRARRSAPRSTCDVTTSSPNLSLRRVFRNTAPRHASRGHGPAGLRAAESRDETNNAKTQGALPQGAITWWWRRIVAQRSGDASEAEVHQVLLATRSRQRNVFMCQRVVVACRRARPRCCRGRRCRAVDAEASRTVHAERSSFALAVGRGGSSMARAEGEGLGASAWRVARGGRARP